MSRSPGALAVHALLAAVMAVPTPAAMGQGIEVTEAQPLAFGRFVAGDGTVVMSPSGVRSTTGNAIALTMDPGQAAHVVVTGAPGTTYAITLPADGTVVLSNGTHAMAVNAFTSNSASPRVLSAGGTDLVQIGATLEVESGRPAGAYSGSFSIVVDYN